MQSSLISLLIIIDYYKGSFSLLDVKSIMLLMLNAALITTIINVFSLFNTLAKIHKLLIICFSFVSAVMTVGLMTGELIIEL